MAKLNYLSTGYTITDETVSRTSSTALRIGHDLIKATGFEIWTGSGKTGTQLTLTTDYVLSAEATDYTTKVGSTIYTKLAIVNGAYLNTTLYISYVTVGDYASVENVKELSWKTIKTAAQWTSDNTILGLGETGRETDTGKEKTGDGVTAWNSLGYTLSPLSYTPVVGNVMLWNSIYNNTKTTEVNGNGVNGFDGRSITRSPDQYSFGTTNEFLTGTQLGGVPDLSSFCFVITIRMWTDDSAGVSQRLIFSGVGHLYIERGSGSSWSGTKTLIA